MFIRREWTQNILLWYFVKGKQNISFSIKVACVYRNRKILKYRHVTIETFARLFDIF